MFSHWFFLSFFSSYSLYQVEITVHPMIVFNLFDPVRVAYETFDLVRRILALFYTNCS